MKTALIGLGMVAGTFAKAMTGPDAKVQLKGVWARRPESRAEFLRDYAPHAHPYTSFAELLSDPELDFVIVATPPDARKELVEALAEAGKPILMEKPIERDLPAARELVELCEAQQVPLGIVLQHRMRPSAIKLRELLATDDFGPLMAVEIAVPWWRPQSYYNEPGRGTIARDGGGVMITQAIHILDLALSFAGPVALVSGMTATTGLHRMEGEDFAAAGLRFRNGAVGHMMATTAAFPGRGETVHLHYGNVVVSLAGGALGLAWRDRAPESFGEAAATGAGADPMAFTHRWHQAIIEDFAESLVNTRAPLVTGRKALEVHRLIDAISRSAASGRQEEVLP